MDQGNQLEDCASRRNDKIKNHRLSSAQERLRRASMHLTNRKCLILITRSDNLHQGFIQMTSPVFLIMIPVRFHQTSQLAAMTQNLDGARGGGTLIRAELSRFHKKKGLVSGYPRPGSVNQSFCSLVSEYFILSKLTIFLTLFMFNKLTMAMSCPGWHPQSKHVTTSDHGNVCA